MISADMNLVVHYHQKQNQFTVSSVARVSGENEDSYVHFYIQIQNTCIPYKSLLLQLLEHEENDGQSTTG